MSEQTRTESAAFLNYALCRVAMAAGMSEVHAGYIADAIVFAHRQGKLNQGLGVYEAIDLVLEVGVMDPTATPELIQEGPAYAVYDGHRSSGYYTLNLMARTAIEKARETGIAIVFGANHNDAGSFARYPIIRCPWQHPLAACTTCSAARPSIRLCPAAMNRRSGPA